MKVAEFTEKSKDPATTVPFNNLFNKFAAELKNPQPDKSNLEFLGTNRKVTSINCNYIIGSC
ncbi:MAG: hypothetical protein WCF06_05195 [Nitrososphaeraceae archaeon]